MVRIGSPGLFDNADAVRISVTFSWDIPAAERLAEEWFNKVTHDVTLGGPATGMAGGTFVPGEYLREGYVITSRGCPNGCWFCDAWKREGTTRELPVRDGWNVMDDNLLACSDEHIRKVFAMLARQEQRPEFTGGLEAARLKPWHVEGLRALRPVQMFFAYDTPEDREPLYEAGRLLIAGGFTATPRSHVMRAYVLIGYPGDTFDAAKFRLWDAVQAGFFPMAMLYRDKGGKRDPEWMRFQRQWARPEIIAATCKEGK